MCRINKILLYINTVKYLKGTQICHQILKRLPDVRLKKLRSQRLQLRKKRVVPVHLFIPTLDGDAAYLSRYQIKDLQNNEIKVLLKILHETHSVDLTKWEVADASHLWNYNLHYLEFLIPLAVGCKGDRADSCFRTWCRCVHMWIEHPARDSFAPYTISMRIPNLLICMDLLRERLAGTVLERKLIGSIYQQYQYLLATQELASLANHYFENLKTIVLCCIWFDEKENYRKYFARFCAQIEEQVLADGIHYERSIMYHKIILEGILRVHVALMQTTDGLECCIGASERRRDARRLLPAIQRMAVALASVSRGLQSTPLFNDAGDNVAKDTGSLLRAVQELTGFRISDSRTVFDASGYYKLYADGNALLFDCGQIGPSYMGGHAHCDCLSFVLARDGKMLFSNSGTYQYQSRLRHFFRSTSAHNTLMIDAREQSELWGEHRAARRIRRIKAKVGNQYVSGQFQSYQGDRFYRKIELAEKYMKITDRILAGERRRHDARQFFHVVPNCRYARGNRRYIARQFFHAVQGCRYVRDNGQQFSIWNDSGRLAVIRIPDGSEGLIHRTGDICCFAQDFGRLEQKEVLEIRTPFEESVGVQVVIEFLQGEKEK